MLSKKQVFSLRQIEALRFEYRKSFIKKINCSCMVFKMFFRRSASKKPSKLYGMIRGFTQNFFAGFF